MVILKLLGLALLIVLPVAILAILDGIWTFHRDMKKREMRINEHRRND